MLLVLGAASVLVWLGILLHPARAWDFRPVGEDEPDEPADFEAGPTGSWPSVCVLVPARNEAEVLPHTLPALLQQDYPGQLTVVLVDDRSHDASGQVARQTGQRLSASHRLIILPGAPLPLSWVGKVWALEQAAAACGLASPGIVHPRQRDCLPHPQYVLLTDADILHAPRSVWRLVAESERKQLALNSRMARLRCVSGAERLLIPPFVFFFSLLYPMRWVNNPRRRAAAAAGGCVLLAAESLEKIGGFASLKGDIIDDLNLARRVKRVSPAVRLSLSRTEVSSVRVYDALSPIWTMVRRTAFTELNHSALRLLGTLVGLGLLFVLPPVWCVVGLAMALGGADAIALLLSLEGSAALGLSAIVYWPAVRFFELPRRWVWTLPLAGSLYGAMTVDSALRYWTGRRVGWRDT